MSRSRSLSRFARLLTTWGLWGCTVVLDRERTQCRSHADCQALGTDSVCASDRVCVTFTPLERTDDALEGDECRRDMDCFAVYGQALCRSGVCRPLNDEASGCVSNGWPDAPSDGSLLPIGVLVPRDELAGPKRTPGVAATVRLSLGELNRARVELGAPLPPLAGVVCDDSNPAALDYLLDVLRTRVIIGPTRTSSVEAALQRTRDASLLVLPFADAPDLQPVVDDSAGLLASCKPNRGSVRGYLLRAVEEARESMITLGAAGPDSITTALAVSDDTATNGFAMGISDADLAASDVRRVSYTSEPGGVGLVRALQRGEPAPNLIVAASAEDAWEENMAAVDEATYAATQTYPFYLLSDKREPVRLSAAGQRTVPLGSLPRSQRVLGLDYHRSADNQVIFADFTRAFSAEMGSAPEAGLEYVYDCTYLMVYATFAASARLRVAPSEVSATAILYGIDALHGGGPLVSVGGAAVPSVVDALTAGHGTSGVVNLVGSSGDLEFGELSSQLEADPLVIRFYRSVLPPDGELYCIDATTTSFCNTGIVFPVLGGPTARGAAGCNCLRSD
jgi:hypothetical protein